MADQEGRAGHERPEWMSDNRIAYLVCLIASLLLLWQAIDLDMWTIVGPGPGLFPSIATGFCSVLAMILLLFPGLGDDRKAAVTEQPVEEEPPLSATERRLFWIYCFILPLLVVGTAYLGFLVFSIVLTTTLTWWAEGRNWRGALLFGVACGLVGDIGFNHFLSTSVPLSEVDQILLRLFH